MRGLRKEGRLLGSSLLCSVSCFTLTATLDGDIEGRDRRPSPLPGGHQSWVCPHESLVTDGMAPYALPGNRHRHLLCPWLGPTGGHHLLAYSQPLCFCWPLLVSCVDSLSSVG